MEQSSDSKVRQNASLQVQTKYLMGVVSMSVPCLTERRGEEARVCLDRVQAEHRIPWQD